MHSSSTPPNLVYGSWRRAAVDVGALSGPGDGIGRYLRSLLPRLIQADTRERSWLLYGRAHAPGSILSAAPPDLQTESRNGCCLRCGPQVQWRTDGLPQVIGRALSLFCSQPLWLRDDRPDVFWGPAHRLPLWIPRETARVVTVHDLCWRSAPNTMRSATRLLDQALMPQALRLADRVIAVSEPTRAALLEFDLSLKNRVVTVPEAAETLPTAQSFSALMPHGVFDPYVLFVGNLEPRKNLARLIEAFASLDVPLRQCHQVVIAGGRGWGRIEVTSMAAKLGIADRVRVLGFVGDQLLSTLYRHARCLAMPSLYEGFGLPVLEALSQGTPALIAGGSSLPEVAGDAGLVVDPLSVDSIRAGLEAMLTDDVLHARLAAAAIPQASKFSWERAAKETLAVFEEAIAVRKEKIRLGLA